MIKYVVLISLLIHATIAQKNLPRNPAKNVGTAPKKWPTLTGKQPLVIARGGFSGLFPEGSNAATDMAKATSLQDLVLLCSLQLTKDGNGFCLSNLMLDNTTNASELFPKGQRIYNVNGKQTRGWFSVDYSLDQMYALKLVQNIYTRPNIFDLNLPVATVDDMLGLKPSAFWLDVPYDQFYSEHKVDALGFVQKTARMAKIDIISCPEVGFLKRLTGKVNKARTKIIFRFLGANEIEPTTKQTYGAILKDLDTIKSFASGILVPKEYIVPIKPDNYLGAPTSLVADAHKKGLEVYANGFANDNILSYNYSYDPSSEYLQFVGSPDFSVDGVVTDFPFTASESIACFTEDNISKKPRQGRSLIISSNGASGVYPGSTDLAYQQAIDDGADIIDCSVQMTKDQVAFCLNSADLTSGTTAMASFMSRMSIVPEIQTGSGIFSFDLTWSEIQSLKPQLVSPYQKNGFRRNPAQKDKGKLLTLAEFLELAKTKAVSGVMINIDNAAYLASKKGLDIVGAVATALTHATLDKQSTQKVLIQSSDTSVLEKFKDVPNYKRVLSIEEKRGSVPKQSIEAIKKYADAVNIVRGTVIEVADSFTTRATNVVKDMKAANLTVFLRLLRNEYCSLAFDYFSDPILEIATYVEGIQVDGIVTEYPATAAKYMRSTCSDPNNQAATFPILPINPGDLSSMLPPGALPAAQAPMLPLEADDVVDPPLPPVTHVSNDGKPPAGSAPSPSSAMGNVANLGLAMLAIWVYSAFSVGQ